MRGQFDSCSYGELTECVKYRIKGIREYQALCKNEILKDFPQSQANLRLSNVIANSEIKKLLKMRRALKRSYLKNWDSEVLIISNN